MNEFYFKNQLNHRADFRWVLEVKNTVSDTCISKKQKQLNNFADYGYVLYRHVVVCLLKAF